MNINKNIIDQRIQKIIAENPIWFEDLDKDHERKISRAFLLLGVAAYLGIELAEAITHLTDGGNDVGIDALYIAHVTDIDFTVVLFQSKYKRNIENEAHFPENAVKETINSLNFIFGNHATTTFNNKLKIKVAEVQSLSYDDFLKPNVKCVMLNNGISWSTITQEKIDHADFPKQQVEFEHFNHDNIINFLQSNKPINTTLKFEGQAFEEGFNFKKVVIGKMNVGEIAKLFEQFGDRIIEKNIRKYLGLSKDRVNSQIQQTLLGEKREDFYFYNNGITMICNYITRNAFQKTDWTLKVEGLQVINGGQTCKTIQETINQNPDLDYSKTHILVRLYELDKEDEALINAITIATNTQNPVDLRDLRANDEMQKKMEIALADLGYIYKRKKELSLQTTDTISAAAAAEAVFTIWREAPHIAKFKKDALFGKFYDQIFTNLNAAQLILAVVIFRFCDNQRRKENLIALYPHLPYSHYLLAMIIGKLVLSKNKIELEQLNHKNIGQIKPFFESEKENLYIEANKILVFVLQQDDKQYPAISLQKFASTFRRGEIVAQIIKKLN